MYAYSSRCQFELSSLLAARTRGTHERYKQSHDIERADPRRPDDPVPDGLSVEYAGGEEQQHRREGNCDEVERDTPGLDRAMRPVGQYPGAYEHMSRSAQGGDWHG